MTSPIAVPDLISHIESTGFPYAYRFEPVTFANLRNGAMTYEHAQIVKKIQQIHLCNETSAQVIYSSSYGLYQIMGFNLYGQLNCIQPFGEFLETPNIQTLYFETLLVKMDLQNITALDLATDPDARHKFAVAYNGSSVYADAICSALQFFRIPVTN